MNGAMQWFFVLTEKTMATNSLSSVLQVVYVFVLFILVIGGAFYTTKLLGKYQMNRMKTSNLKIVDSIGIGPQKSILLIKVGTEYVLVGVTKEQISLIREITEEKLDLNLLNMNNSLPNVSFGKYLEKFQNKKDNGKNVK